MPSHHHRHSQPELIDVDVVDVDVDVTQPPRLPEESKDDFFSRLGFKDGLDCNEINRMMVYACHPEAKDYVLALTEMLGDSRVFSTIRNIVKKRSDGNHDTEMLMVAALLFLTGACCTLKAVDEGFLDDEDYGGGEGGEGEEGVEGKDDDYNGRED